ncbi:recombination protein RecR, partial [bacterium]
MLFAKPLAELISELEKLPGVGPKSAQRLAYHLLRTPDHQTDRLAAVILAAKSKLRFCDHCQNVSEGELCEICRDGRRQKDTLCVVAEPKDLTAMERIHEYKGLYHVLHGLLSPMDGVGPEQLRVKELLRRLADGEVMEIIIATNPTIEGDA